MHVYTLPMKLFHSQIIILIHLVCRFVIILGELLLTYLDFSQTV